MGRINKKSYTYHNSLYLQYMPSKPDLVSKMFWVFKVVSDQRSFCVVLQAGCPPAGSPQEGSGLVSGWRLQWL